MYDILTLTIIWEFKKSSVVFLNLLCKKKNNFRNKPPLYAGNDLTFWPRANVNQLTLTDNVPCCLTLIPKQCQQALKDRYFYRAEEGFLCGLLWKTATLIDMVSHRMDTGLI